MLLDLRLNEDDPANREGVELLQTLQERFPQLPVLMITAHGDIDTAIECMRLGATDFIQKARANVQEVKARVAQALAHARLSRRVTELERDIQLVEPRTLIGQSEVLREVKQYVEAIARDGNATVLIRGETGTGKELVARAIHAIGERRDGPFVPVVLNALPAETIESELFGYERGAFTGANQRHTGYLEKAHGGVLFLDEIGEMEPGVQVKLLRFLEEQTFQRLGSTEPVCVDVQIVTATNADLERRVGEGRFREDLYYRLKVHEITIPPLRDRAEDIPRLVEHFLGLFRRQGKGVGKISPEAMAALERFDWPGNVRQLKNVLEAAVFRANMHGHGQIETNDLPTDVRQPGASPRQSNLPDLPEGEANIDALLARAELNYAEQALKAANGKITEAWALLGYNDRFVFSRRIRRILERYPVVAVECPYVERLFRGTST